jgi:hypothetical protein
MQGPITASAFFLLCFFELSNSTLVWVYIGIPDYLS